MHLVPKDDSEQSLAVSQVYAEDGGYVNTSLWDAARNKTNNPLTFGGVGSDSYLLSNASGKCPSCGGNSPLLSYNRQSKGAGQILVPFVAQQKGSMTCRRRSRSSSRIRSNRGIGAAAAADQGPRPAPGLQRFISSLRLVQ